MFNTLMNKRQKNKLKLKGGKKKQKNRMKQHYSKMHKT